MKQLIIICTLAIALFTSCAQRDSYHDTVWSPDKKDSAVYVNYRQEDGSFTRFYMNYMLYSMLFNNGGYNNVYNYYRTNPGLHASQSRYTSYRSASNFASSYGSSSPSRSRSGSWGSSSGSSRSYSSPSRSYSSPSRSYSSPSRSYSSPARSHSFSHH